MQSSSYNASATLWVQSFHAATFAYLYRSVDLELFIEWLNAYEDGDKKRAIFFEQRFRPEFRPVFEAWLANPAVGKSRGTEFSLRPTGVPVGAFGSGHRTETGSGSGFRSRPGTPTSKATNMC